MNTLDQICADKREHVQRKKQQFSLSDLQKKVKDTAPTYGFINALLDNKKNGYAFITEVKKASPSKGVIREDFHPVEIAQTYQNNGAACLSVLTDEKYFQGHDNYFVDIRNAVTLPMLRKDFMIDSYQIIESRAMGADCILLIMACLSDDQAKEFYDLSSSLGMDTLFEVHDKKELDRAIKLSPEMIGVNNRNLKTLEVNLQTGLDLANHIPNNILKVGESGLSSPNDLKSFTDAGYDAFLIGESLMKQDDIGATLANLLKISLDTNGEHA